MRRVPLLSQNTMADIDLLKFCSLRSKFKDAKIEDAEVGELLNNNQIEEER